MYGYQCLLITLYSLISHILLHTFMRALNCMYIVYNLIPGILNMKQ